MPLILVMVVVERQWRKSKNGANGIGNGNGCNEIGSRWGLSVLARAVPEDTDGGTAAKF